MGKTRQQSHPQSLEQYNTEQLDKARRALVKKANVVIQKTRYSLSLKEQKVLLFVMTKIQPGDTAETEYNFDIREFCAVCGIAATNYKDVRDTFVNMKKKAFWMDIGETSEDDTESCIDWFTTTRMYKRSGIIKLKFHEDLFPFLSQIRSDFTTFSIYPTLVMKSRYSIRLYELLKSYSNLTEWVFDIEDLKCKLDAENYKRFADFRRNILDITQKEINQYTELEISYEPLKHNSRQYNKVRFFISIKAPFFVLQADKEVSKELDSSPTEPSAQP